MLKIEKFDFVRLKHLDVLYLVKNAELVKLIFVGEVRGNYVFCDYNNLARTFLLNPKSNNDYEAFFVGEYERSVVGKEIISQLEQKYNEKLAEIKDFYGV